MGQSIDIHETAFVTCNFRADHPQISGDKYAHLWLNDRVKQIKDAYLNEVSTEESVSHAMRNYFFMKTISDLYKVNKIDAVINFGSGFSMYPFLMPKGLMHIEIDKPEVIDFKENFIRKWLEDGILPRRDIIFISTNFEEDYVEKLKAELQNLIGNKRTFILVEGVLFFLNMDQTNTLFELFGSLQSNSGYIGSASYEPEIKNTTAFKRLLQFATDNVNPTEPQNFLYLPTGFYENIKDYKLINHQDFYSRASFHNYKPELKPDLILNEHYYILKKD